MSTKYDITNCHIHVTRWEDKNGICYLENCRRFLDATGENGMCLQALTVPGYGGAEQNGICALYKMQDPRAYAFGGILLPHRNMPQLLRDGDPLTQYRELMEIGFDGIKFLYKPDVVKNMPYPISHPMYDGLFAAMERDGTPIMWHVADPPAFWTNPVNPKWDYSDGTYPAFREMLEQVFAVMERHPLLNVTFAHFLFLAESPDTLEHIFERYPRVKLDITPGTEMYGVFSDHQAFYRDFFERHRDRILFGSDADPSRRCESNLDEAIYRALTTEDTVSIWGQESRGLGLSEDILERILSRNFLSLCGENPRPINRKALLGYVEKYKDFAFDREIMEKLPSAL